MPDRDKVIKRIEDCVFQRIECVDCDYDGCIFKHGDCRRDLLADALATLKEQPELVRCKDCKHYDGNECMIKMGWFAVLPDWFCADGERKEGR